MLTPNQPNQSSKQAPAPKRLCVWIFHDARPGHLSQLEGLAKRLTCHTLCDIRWFDVNQTKLNFQHLLFVPKFLRKHTKPDLIIGAGHSTHLSIMIAGFRFKAFTSIIMKPSLPLRFFNAVICPKHDGLTDSPHVFTTFGPINNVDRSNLIKPSEKSLNLIVLGGVSKHFHFDEHQILAQIKITCSSNPSTQWIVCNSARTPQSTNKALTELSFPNLTFYHYQSNKMGPLQEMLLHTRYTLMTPDSMSMIFEALSAGSKVELIQCKPKNNNRIVKQIEQLIEEGFVIYSKNNTNIKPEIKNIPWEADRAAIWLLQSIKKYMINESK